MKGVRWGKNWRRWKHRPVVLVPVIAKPAEPPQQPAEQGDRKSKLSKFFRRRRSQLWDSGIPNHKMNAYDDGTCRNFLDDVLEPETSEQ